MNIGFVMYDWESIKPELDSTLRLIQESIKRGHKVSAIYPNEMAIRRTIVWANCYVVTNSNPNTNDTLCLIEPFLFGIVLGMIPVSLAGLFVAAYLQYRRGNQLI
jgi:hypothetical protein